MMKQEADHLHVAMLPSPGMGHIIPMVEFAKRLLHHKHHLLVTLIIPDSGLHLNEQKPFLESLPKRVSLVLLPKPDLDDLLQTNQIRVMCNTIARSLSSLQDVVRSLAATANLVALVVDFLGTAAFEVAREFNVSPYLFFPCNAMFSSLYLYLPQLDATVSGPYQDFPGPVQVPGCIPIRAPDLPDPFKDRKGPAYKWVMEQCKRYQMAAGILVNTFSGIEGGTIKALQNQKYPPVYPIGPLVRQTDSIRSPIGTGGSASMTIKWLDGQLQDSILFLCFGSMGLLSKPQIHELAFGLELSEKGFLLVVRISPDSDPLSLLPQGFVERTKGRGLLVSGWAPQAQILGHASTGGFLTHCGWNSVLESIANGVPMIAWPLYAEQKMNATMLTEDLKVAVRPRVSEEQEDGLVGRMEIANSVKNLMDGEKGKKLRERTRALKEAAKMAVDVGGESTKSLAEFVGFFKQE